VLAGAARDGLLFGLGKWLSVPSHKCQKEELMLGEKTWDEWVAQYSQSHQHPVNRACHTVGIPMIVASIAMFVAAFFVESMWLIAAGTFVVGWILQFVGHWYEGKPPEFFRDWRFLFVGLRWWAAKVRGRA
jgi:uncharacterized membrane protein YGL010W